MPVLLLETMTQFRFRLAAPLRLREATRDERRMELAETQRADAELRSQLSRLTVEQERLECDCRAVAGPGAVDLPRLLHAQRYAAVLRMQRVALRRRRESLTAEIDRCRQALIEADRDVQSLEKLRQTQSEAHRQEEDRQEAQRLDEAAMNARDRRCFSGE